MHEFTRRLRSSPLILRRPHWVLPIVAPRLGEIAANADRPYVSAYSADSDDQLEQAIRFAVDRMRSTEVSQAAIADAAIFGPTEMSNAFFEAIAVDSRTSENPTGSSSES